MKQLFKIVLVSCISLLFSSCYYDNLVERPIEEIDPGVEVLFGDDIQQIFADYNCAQCHDGSRDPDLRTANAYNALVPEYVDAGNPEGSELYTILADGHRNVAAGDLALIYAWIERGAENN